MLAISKPIHTEVSNLSRSWTHKDATNILPLQQYFQKILFAFFIDNSVTELQTYLKTFLESKVLLLFHFQIIENFFCNSNTTIIAL